jgi:hypothetical protein
MGDCIVPVEPQTLPVDPQTPVELQAARQAAYLNNLKELVMRQTDYTEEQALEKLQEHNKNVMAIIREFMGGGKKIINTENKSVNQQIYGEIRTLMDTAAATYKAKKEREELQQRRQEMYNEHMRKKHAEASVTTEATTEAISTSTTDTVSTTTTDAVSTTDTVSTTNVVNVNNIL